MFSKKIIALIFLFGISCSQIVFSENGLSEWRSHTNSYDVRSSTVDSRGRIWAGTAGGVFVFTPETGELNKLTNINGLQSIDISKISYHPGSKKIYVAAHDGNIDIADEDYNWENVTDIKASDYSNPSINDIAYKDSLIYFACGFGLTVLNTNNNTFPDTYDKIGDFQRMTAVNHLLIRDNEIWLGTGQGIVKASLGDQLYDPESWEKVPLPNEINETEIFGLTEFNGNIYAATEHHVLYAIQDSFALKHTLEEFNSFSGFAAFNDELYFATPFLIFSFDDYKQIHSDWKKFINNISSLGESRDKILISTRDNGIGIFDGASVEYYAPNSPVSNIFPSLDVDKDGKLWVGSGDITIGKGISFMEEGIWTNLDKDNTPELESDAYWTITAHPDGRIVSGNWGDGCAVLNNDGTVIERYDDTNSPFTHTKDIEEMVLCADSKSDRYGNIWILNYGYASNGPVIAALDPEGIFHPFVNCITSNNRTYSVLEIDMNNTKWMGSNQSGGILYFNDNNDLSGESGLKCGILKSSTSGLPSNEITCLAQDQNGILWIGTKAGLAYIINTSAVMYDESNVIVRASNIASLKNIIINDIMVDALNNKWVATNEGVRILDPDGVEIGHVNIENSKLLSNDVISLATNINTGTIYFGTSSGLSEAKSLSLKPLSDFNIKCYPQPFNPVKDEQLVIEGLGPDASIKILTLDGALVRSINTTGRKAVWDGFDESGSSVSTGVYLVIAASGSSETTGVAKIALIRK